MKLSIGDVMTGLDAGQDAEKLYITAFANSEWRLVDDERLSSGFPTIFGMVFENMPRWLAQQLHEALNNHEGYLGAVSVHLEYGPHLALYRLRLPLEYRLEGTRLKSFFSMGNEDGCDEYDLQEMTQLGFDDVAFEDSGASRTILDDYDTPRHFERVAGIRNLLTRSLKGGEDDAYELTMLLEDLSPKLFNVLGAAAERLENSENEEDLAQVALSGRRYMEQLADALFPAEETSEGERSLSKVNYKNRLWAFAENATDHDPSIFVPIGKEIDRIVKEVNGGLHADRPKERVEQSLSDAAKLTISLFALDPEAVKNGYLAYSESLRAFVRELSRSN